MTEVHPAHLTRLIRALAVLALPFEDQLVWLSSLGLPGQPQIVDELALEFDDGVRLSGQFVEAGWISGDARRPILELDQMLSEMSGPEQAWLWEVDSLHTAEEWVRVRGLARTALFSL